MAELWKGVDVSGYQRDINWSKVRRAGYRFAIVKATEGATHFSPTRREHSSNAKAADMKISYYHFAHPSIGDAPREAKHFAEELERLPAPDAMPIHGYESRPVVWLDLEKDKEKGKRRLNDRELDAWCVEFVHTVEKLSGYVCGVYGSPGSYLKRLKSPILEERPLWIAHYTSKDSPSIRGPWTEWAVWQHSSDGTVPGIPGNCDVNRLQVSTYKTVPEAKLPTACIVSHERLLIVKDWLLGELAKVERELSSG